MSPRALRPRLAAVLALALAAATLTALAGCRVKDNTTNLDLVTGKQLFVSKCGSCHTLGRAMTKGTVGPNLDAAFAQDLRDGFGRDEIRGIVRAQIANPNLGGAMPANLVTGTKADDVAAYVAFAVDMPGQDTGLLATAVKAPGAGKPAVETGGQLEIDADPSGQLAYVTTQASGSPGPVTVKMRNASGVPHNIALQKGTSGPVLGSSAVVSSGGSSQFHAALKRGSYTYFCQVDGHRAAGMLGTLVVK
jgi:mono/diheme cytochrome c family protein